MKMVVDPDLDGGTATCGLRGGTPLTICALCGEYPLLVVHSGIGQRTASLPAVTGCLNGAFPRLRSMLNLDGCRTDIPRVHLEVEGAIKCK